MDKLGLKYVDLLTYVAVKSFRNHQDNSCYPAYETIGQRMGASRSFVISSVDRLIKSGFMFKDKRYNNSNKYHFVGNDLSTKVPPQILQLDLSIYEKAMLLVMRQFASGTPTTIMHDITWISNKLGVTYKTVYTQIQGLIAKGYLVEKIHYKATRYELTDLLDWYYERDIFSSIKSTAEDFIFLLA